jgi:hypothetical protein
MIPTSFYYVVPKNQSVPLAGVPSGSKGVEFTNKTAVDLYLKVVDVSKTQFTVSFQNQTRTQDLKTVTFDDSASHYCITVGGFGRIHNWDNDEVVYTNLNIVIVRPS